MRNPSYPRMREERVDEDARIVRGLRRGDLDLRAQRAQRAVRAMHRVHQQAATYTDPWIEAEEAAASQPLDLPRFRPVDPPSSPQTPKKPILTEKQRNVVFDVIFGKAAPAAQTAVEMAQTDVGQKVMGIGGLIAAAMLLPLVGGIVPKPRA